MTEAHAPPSDETEPRGELCTWTLAMPADTNANGDIFGGWLLSQMDIARGVAASKIAKTRTVTVRDLASFDANTPPPTSIWLSSQPPKMSPLALVSAGIASVRVQRSPRGPLSSLAGACTCFSVSWVSVT